jgi:hypothetical protein
VRSLRLGRSIHLTARLGGEERRTSDEGRSYVVAQGRRGWDESAGLFRQPWRRNAAGRREACGSQIGSDLSRATGLSDLCVPARRGAHGRSAAVPG